MAKHHYAEKDELNDSVPEEERRFWCGGGKAENELIHTIKESIAKAKRIDLVVSFLMESGVKLILADLKEAIERKVPIRILCGAYMSITEPSALVILKNELGDHAQLRMDVNKRRSFHPKCYIFHEDDSCHAYLGSSNLSASALTGGVEWNYRIESDADPISMKRICDEFENLFEHSHILDDELLDVYCKTWKKPPVLRQPNFADMIDENDSGEALTPSASSVNEDTNEAQSKESEQETVEPRGAQIEALYALKKTRENGNRKAMIQAATGVGKTYLAAFDSREFDRVLFVAHRREILEQAAKSFHHVRPEKSFGFLDGNNKEMDCDFVFASVSTLSSDAILQQDVLAPDAFDYIVIDEFHHAAANSYTKILDYFTPKFLLGLTATPQRMDGRSVYALCDFNVPYSIDLQCAINRGLLVPFHYYAVYDKTDYSTMRKANGRLNIQDLNEAYQRNAERNELILRHFRKYPSKQAIGFCASKLHAEQMSRFFNENNIPSAAVFSGSKDDQYTKPRQKALDELRKGKLRILFTVDLFNEGLDVNTIDLVLFLRPTESPVIFLQQLGRGLRLAPDKQYLTVLDFIGNYDKASMAPALLANLTSKQVCLKTLQNPVLPENCVMDFDLELIDLFEENHNLKKSDSEWLQEEFGRIRDLLGHRPTQKKLFENLDDDLLQKVLSDAKINPFRDYLRFLDTMRVLTPEEQELRNSPAGEFLICLQQTSMTRVYKMPVLMSFIDPSRKHLRKFITEKEVLEIWKEFFDTRENWRDLAKRNQKNMTYQDFRKISDIQHIAKIKDQPVRFLLKSAPKFFHDSDDGVLALSDILNPWLDSPLLIQHMMNCLAYRTEAYYYRKGYPNSKEKD